MAGTAYRNPFDGKSPQHICDLLTKREFSNGEHPRWPNATVHTTYTGAYGPQFVHSRLEFVNALDVDGAFLSGWRELAYGCGFGRFASLLLSKGPAEQPDLVDAWALSIDHITNGGFKNKCWMVSELPENDLKPGITILLRHSRSSPIISKDAFLTIWRVYIGRSDCGDGSISRYGTKNS